MKTENALRYTANVVNIGYGKNNVTGDSTVYFQDFCGATASITKHKDGSATLRTCAGTTRTCKKYKSYDSAYQAWRRMCN
ncbi:MAG: hypothetical protein IJE78_05155 [Bacteroidaceae bacterium]|nr:hypothetical protein [Bacteroidaceae bacterium]